jgi:hypothetical protein
MNAVTTLSKRERIENLVRTSIVETAVADNHLSTSGLPINMAVKIFTEVWPAKYFNIADERRITGLVLAYLLELAAIGVDDMNEDGYKLLKTAAEIDLIEFSKNMPRTFAQLKQLQALNPENGVW